MVQEIKFRAWDSVCKKWLSIPIKRIDDEYNCSELVQELPSIRIMQFTRLRDKNGKEIYEGDILKIGDHRAEVYWYRVHGAWYIRWKDFCQELAPELRGFVEVEVVGNIYENPEKLKEETKE